MEDQGDALDVTSIRGYVRKALEGFLLDPPDSDYQLGYMAAMKQVYTEGLLMQNSDALIVAITKIEQ
jgi:hypothetical protein